MEKISGSGEQPQNTGENGKSIPKSAYEQVFFEQLRSGVEYDESKLSDEQLEAYKAAKKSYEKTKAINKERKQEHDKKLFKKITAGALVAMIGTGIKVAKDSGVFNGIRLNSPEPVTDVSAEGNEATTEDTESTWFYGGSNPYEITIGSEARNEFGLEEYTNNEKLNSVLNQTGEQFYLPGMYSYKKENKVTPNAVANPKAIYEYMGVANPEKPTLEETIDAIKYVNYGQGFVSSGVATIFAGAGLAPEGFTTNYDKNQEHVYSMEKGGEERLAHEEWIEQVFENSTFKRAQTTFSKLHMYGNEKKTGKDGEVLGNMTNGDSKLRDVIEQTYTDPKTGVEITVEWQEECFNLGQTAKIKKKDGTVYYVTVPDKPDTPTTITETPPEDPVNPPAKPPVNPPVNPPSSDAKSAEAIENNMQTGPETNNYVTPTGPGNIESRPDTSSNSYQNEVNYQQETAEQTYSAPSESEQYDTIGDAIWSADQTYSDHVTYTEPIDLQALTEQQAADDAAEAIKQEAEEKSKISDSDAADWFNSLNK